MGFCCTDFCRREISNPILGADFLHHFGFLVDVKRGRLVDNATGLTVRGIATQSPLISPVVFQFTTNRYADILKQYSDITRPVFRENHIKHDVAHHIQTQGPPVTARPWRFKPNCLKVAKQEFQHIMYLGSFTHPAVVGPPHFTWSLRKRPMTGAPAEITGHLIATPPRIITRFLICTISPARSTGCPFSPKLIFCELTTRFQSCRQTFQKRQSPHHSDYSIFFRMLFGLRNAAETFQRFTDAVIRGLPFVYAYIDDLLVASSSKEEHTRHLHQLFQRLTQYGVVVNHSKCEFGATSLSFFGHVIDKDGIRSLPEKVKFIMDYLAQMSLRKLREFLGFINFYRRFLPHCAETAQPLTDLLRHRTKKNEIITLTEHELSFFSKLKQILAEATMLVFPKADTPLYLLVDGSDVRVRGVLQQLVDNTWQPLSFFSRRLQLVETKYSAFGRELQAAYSAVRHFRYMLEGAVFTMYTNHKPLAHTFHAKSGRH